MKAIKDKENVKIEKEEKANKAKKKNKPIMPGVIAFGLVASTIVFAVMINAEKNLLADYEKGTIYTTIQSIPKGMVITEENFSFYFQPKEIDKNLISSVSITNAAELQGLIPSISIEAGTFLARGMFESVDEVTDGMKEPVVAGFKAEDLYQVTGGVLRAGDRIHIYNIGEDGAASLVWDNIYVCQVFDSAGNLIRPDDEDTAAQRVNIYLDKADVESFYEAMSTNSLRVVKKVR